MRTARIVQLVSSGLTKDWGEYGPAFIGHTLSHEIFESATTPTQPHAERVGWGTPLKQVPVEPPTIGDIVTVPDGAVAHPTYRARLRMRAPVVPTHGWPAGTTEARDPNWAWRAFMVRDEREEFPTTPTAVSRTTPVELPADPLSPSHRGLARRGGAPHGLRPRVLLPAERRRRHLREGPRRTQWAVRHVLAGELPPMPPMPEAGFTPVGLQPFIVHKVSLTPPAADDLAVRTGRASSTTAAGAATTAIRRSSCCCTSCRGCGSAPPASSAPTGSSPAARWWSTTSCARRC